MHPDAALHSWGSAIGGRCPFAAWTPPHSWTRLYVCPYCDLGRHKGIDLGWWLPGGKGPVLCVMSKEFCDTPCYHTSVQLWTAHITVAEKRHRLPLFTPSTWSGLCFDRSFFSLCCPCSCETLPLGGMENMHPPGPWPPSIGPGSSSRGTCQFWHNGS